MDLGISDKVKPILEEVKHFIDTEILPLEQEYHGEVSKGDRWTFTERQTEILESLKAKARANRSKFDCGRNLFYSLTKMFYVFFISV